MKKQNESIQPICVVDNSVAQKFRNRAGKNKKFGGYGLVEIMLGVVVVSVLTYIAVTVYGNVTASSDAKRVTQDFQMVSQSVKNTYSQNSTGYTSSTMQADVIGLGLIPKTLAVNGNTISNSFKGDFTITGATGGTNTFTVSSDKIPKRVLVDTVSSLGTDGIVAIGVGADCVYSTGATGSTPAGCTDGTPVAYDVNKVNSALGTASNGKLTVVYN